jgi:hypothetical protein
LAGGPLDARRGCQQLERGLAFAGAFLLRHELNDVAGGLAAWTAKQPLGRRHAQRGMVVVMERTEADVIAARFLERDAVALDDAHNVGRPFDLVEVHFHNQDTHWPVFSLYSPR